MGSAALHAVVTIREQREPSLLSSRQPSDYPGASRPLERRLAHSCSSVENVIRELVGDASIVNSLVAKAASICNAPNENTKNGKLGAFDNEVVAQTGNALTSAQATLLDQLAAAL